MMKLKRREFIGNAALAAVGGAAVLASPRGASALGGRDGGAGEGAAAAAEKGHSAGIRLYLGLASYTFRAFDLDRTVAMTVRAGLKGIILKDFHLPLDTPADGIAAAAEKVRAAGLDLYGCGVIYMNTEVEVERAFAYAGTAGMRLIIGVPRPELLGLVERKVRETGIMVAVHNHGPEDKLYPTPGSVYEKIKGLDRRIGLGLDIGHSMRSGVDPSEAVSRYFDRVLDVHMKDVTAAAKEGTAVEVGRGVIDIPRFVRTVVKLGYAGCLAFEYEKDEQDPLPGLAESVGYVRGVLADIG